MLALHDQYPNIQGAMLLEKDGNRILQLPPSQSSDELIAKGVQLNNTVCPIRAIHNSNGSDIVQVRVTPFLSTGGGVQPLKDAFAELGDILEYSAEMIPRTSHITGNFDFVLALKDATKLPPSSINVDHGDWTERLSVFITDKRNFCHYCRSTTHLRAECPTAPKCKKCSSRAHPASRCPAPAASAASPAPSSGSPQGPQASSAPRATQADLDDAGRKRRRTSLPSSDASPALPTGARQDAPSSSVPAKDTSAIAHAITAALATPPSTPRRSIRKTPVKVVTQDTAGKGRDSLQSSNFTFSLSAPSTRSRSQSESEPVVDDHLPAAQLGAVPPPQAETSSTTAESQSGAVEAGFASNSSKDAQSERDSDGGSEDEDDSMNE